MKNLRNCDKEKENKKLNKEHYNQKNLNSDILFIYKTFEKGNSTSSRSNIPEMKTLSLVPMEYTLTENRFLKNNNYKYFYSNKNNPNVSKGKYLLNIPKILTNFSSKKSLEKYEANPTIPNFSNKHNNKIFRIK